MKTERLFGMTVPRPVARVAAGVLAVVMFGVVASVIGPHRSVGSTLGGAATPPAPPSTAAATQRAAARSLNGAAPERNGRGGMLLGSMVGGERQVWVYSSVDGPLYTVATAAGVVLAEDLPADDVYRAFPELDIEHMTLEPRADSSAPPDGEGAIRRTPWMSAEVGE